MIGFLIHLCYRTDIIIEDKILVGPYSKDIESFDASKEMISEVSESAFENCQKLKAAILPDTVSIIHAKAFKNCTSLNTLNLDSVMVFEQEAFFGCTSLSIEINDHNLEKTILDYSFAYTNVSKIEIKTYLGIGVFKGCRNIDIINGSSLIISNNAFEDTKIKRIVGNIQVLEYAFRNSEIENMDAAIETISLGSFEGARFSNQFCYNLSYVTESSFKNAMFKGGLIIYHNTSVTIQKSAFQNAKFLQYLCIKSNQITASENSFDGCHGKLIILNNTFFTVDKHGFANSRLLTSSLKVSVASEYSFQNSSFSNVQITTLLASYTFYGSSIENSTISVSQIPEKTIDKNSQLKYLDINVNSLETNAISGVNLSVFNINAAVFKENSINGTINNMTIKSYSTGLCTAFGSGTVVSKIKYLSNEAIPCPKPVFDNKPMIELLPDYNSSNFLGYTVKRVSLIPVWMYYVIAAILCVLIASLATLFYFRHTRNLYKKRIELEQQIINDFG